jgi:hypothetical protein
MGQALYHSDFLPRHSRAGGNPWSGLAEYYGLDSRLRGNDEFLPTGPFKKIVNSARQTAMQHVTYFTHISNASIA